MRKLFSLCALTLFVWSVQAQEFPVTWKSKFNIDPERWFFDDGMDHVLGRSESDAEMLDGQTGKPIWKLNFKTDLGIKSLAKAVYNPENGTILFFNVDEKKKNGEKVIVDFKTGKELWRTDGYAGKDSEDYFHFAHCIGDVKVGTSFVVFDNSVKKFVGLDARSGNKNWESAAYPEMDLAKNVSLTYIEDSDYAYVISDLNILYINIVTGKITPDDTGILDKSGTTTFSRYGVNRVTAKYSEGNTTIKLTGTMKVVSTEKIQFKLESSGDNTWTKKFEGKAVRQLFNDKPYVKMDVQGGKIFLLSKFITVFDMKTGEQLWEAPFDNCDVSIGLKAKQEFGIAGWPLVSGNAVYYVDLKTDNAIKKVDAKTGALIWKSESFSSSDRVPNLTEINGVLIAQFGGMINVQKYIPNSNGGATYKNENKFDGTFGVKAYDVATGKTVWSSDKLADKLGDKFKARISTIYVLNNKLYVASDKNLFCLEPKTGDLIYKTSLEAAKIGDVFEVSLSDDYETFYIFCDNGIASANIATGKLAYATKTDDIFWQLPGTATYSFSQGANFFVWVGESDFIGFDLKTGKIKGKMKDNNNPQMSGDGNFIMIRDGAKITKYAVNP
jgi:hypothetical protein